MPLAAEMDSFQGEVGGDQGLVARWNAQYGAIVADTFLDLIPGLSLPANAGNQRFFENRQGKPIYTTKPFIPNCPTVGGFPQSNQTRGLFIYPAPPPRAGSCGVPEQ